MIKALLIVTSLSGGVNYKTEMPSMETCLDARIVIAKQDSKIKTLCVPKEEDSLKVKEFFTIFMDIVDQLKEYEEIDRFNRNSEQENRSCEDCFRSEK